MTDISDETLDAVERVLRGMVAECYRITFMRTADSRTHGCTCLRCWRDRQDAALVRLREERRK